MRATRISSVIAHEVYADNMKAAIQAVVETEGGIKGTGLCCPGLSTGSYEAPCLYDGGQRFGGYGVQTAVKRINDLLAPALIGMDAANQTACDAVISSLGKSACGAHAAAAVSSAVLCTGARALGLPLYKHIGGVRGFTLPVPGASAATGSTRYGGPVAAGYKPGYSFLAYRFNTFTEASYALWEVIMDWLDYVKTKLGVKIHQPIAGMSFPPGKLANDFQLWDMMADSIVKSGYGGRVGIQADMAATGFYNKNTLMYEGLFDSTPRTRDDLIGLVIRMPRDYPFIVIEDPLMEDDFDGFAEITRNTAIQITGDDLIATNPERLAKAIETGACNAVRISVGQIGTVSEAFGTAEMAVRNNIGIVTSGERGEGSAICDYAVGLNAGTAGDNGMVYSGNRFLQIEKEIGARAIFPGARGIKGNGFQTNR